MNNQRLLFAAAMLLVLSGCNAPLQRGDCQFMMSNERDRCMAANGSNQQIVNERAKAERAERKSRGEFDKADIESSRDQ